MKNKPTNEDELQINKTEFCNYKILDVLAYEKLKNETLREENTHLKSTIIKIKDLLKTKNQNIGLLEERVNFLECEKN